jgi:hypothetical protein
VAIEVDLAKQRNGREAAAKDEDARERARRHAVDDAAGVR